MTKNPPSAVLTPATAQSAIARPSALTVTFRLTESEAEKYGLGNRWRAAMKKREKRQSKKQVAFLTLNATLLRLLDHAQVEQWSRRKLAAKIGIPETTLRWIQRGQADPLVWSAKLQAALDKLKMS